MLWRTCRWTATRWAKRAEPFGFKQKSNPDLLQKKKFKYVCCVCVSARALTHCGA